MSNPSRLQPFTNGEVSGQPLGNFQLQNFWMSRAMSHISVPKESYVQS